jgi:molybdate transport system substrate-binding protein
MLGLAEATRDRLLHVHSGDVAAALAAGEATVGVQLLCELIGRPGIAVVGPLPAALQHEVVAAIGIGAASRCVDAAQGFIEALRAPALAPKLRAAGLEPAS